MPTQTDGGLDARGLEHVACDLCGSDDPIEVFQCRDLELGGKEEFRLVRCAQCNLHYTDPRPSPQRLEAFYPSDYGPYRKRQIFWVDLYQRWMARRRVISMARLAGPRARVLDVGCGTGRMVAALRDAGLDALGVEPSEHGCKTAKAEFGLDLFHGTLADARFADDDFDLVSMFHVLEHVPSPSQDLAEIRRILKPGGKVFIEIPNHDCLEARVYGRQWSGWHLPRHFTHFTPETLGRMLDRLGFDLVSVNFVVVPNFWAGSLTMALKNWLAPYTRMPWYLITSRPLFAALLNPVSYVETRWLGGRGGIMEVVGSKR